jgi:hypothetical protein
MHRASVLLGARLRQELEPYRVLLMIPRLAQPKTPAIPKPEAIPFPAGAAPHQSRLIDRLNPDLAAFIETNPEIGNIISDQIERDLSSRKLDLIKLLAQSSIRISFGLADQGRIRWRRIDESSHVPSLDHLALALIQLLEKYGLLIYVSGLEQVSLSIRIDQSIEIELVGQLLPNADPVLIRGQIDAGLLLWRLFLSPEEELLWQNISIEIREHQILLSKKFEKGQLIQVLKEYYKREESN